MLCIAPLVFLIVQWLIASVGAINCAPSSQSFTIKTSQDVSDIITCATFTGNVVVAADGPEEVSLDGVTAISGNLDVENVAQLRSLSSQTLTTVSSFTLNNLPKLAHLSFPSLANVSSIKWYALPALEDADVTPGKVNSEVDEISIFNTSISNLDWISWPLGSLLNLTSNANLQSFAVTYGEINPGSTLVFSDNAAFRNLTVSQLTGIYGALQVSENPELKSLDFAVLQTIGGYVQLSGDYVNLSMSALNQVNGALNVASTGDISDLCNDLDQKASSHILNGHYDCTANSQKNPTSPSASATTSIAMPTTTATDRPPADGNNGDLSSAAKIAMGVLIPLVAIVSSFLTCLCLRRRLRSKVREIEKNVEERSDSTEPSESNTGNSEPKELESIGTRVEIGIGHEIQELQAEEQARELDAIHGKSELETPITPLTPAGSWWSGHSDTPLVRHELPA
ncbi:hypothetical protein BDV96DRAFT_60980 [Lophiotrema nucula]|uniref:Receptor L-domain domain-containing protein n=1 Tax=Lophiotrema nucula TaxID=690887 RepID=A0A6A5ZB30_9PLEO|nr:hypothetical protein BDV96DRAFT_60980 [Lophiotrema nucula]